MSTLRSWVDWKSLLSTNQQPCQPWVVTIVTRTSPLSIHRSEPLAGILKHYWPGLALINCSEPLWNTFLAAINQYHQSCTSHDAWLVHWRALVSTTSLRDQASNLDTICRIRETCHFFTDSLMFMRSDWTMFWLSTTPFLICMVGWCVPLQCSLVRFSMLPYRMPTSALKQGSLGRWDVRFSGRRTCHPKMVHQ